MAKTEPQQDPIDLPRSPDERWLAKLRRHWRSQVRHPPLRFWLTRWGPVIAFGWVAIYVIAGVAVGWREAYDVMLAIASPAATRHPLAAWPLSILGWLVGPAAVGAVVSAVVTASIRTHRRQSPIRRSKPELDTWTGDVIPLLRDALFKSNRGIGRGAAEFFVKLHLADNWDGLPEGSSDKDWRLAQNHFERFVNEALGTDAVPLDATGRRAMREAVAHVGAALQAKGFPPICKYCAKSQPSGGERG